MKTLQTIFYQDEALSILANINRDTQYHLYVCLPLDFYVTEETRRLLKDYDADALMCYIACAQKFAELEGNDYQIWTFKDNDIWSQWDGETLTKASILCSGIMLRFARIWVLPYPLDNEQQQGKLGIVLSYDEIGEL
ncbi:MAG: hypothetical protein F6K19_52025 [Cyanothece sp. SIO1E1]|nr:hypothetical protein [Cyanothece sp. SIO1E1]